MRQDLIHLHKKSNKTQNYWGIATLNSTYKTLSILSTYLNCSNVEKVCNQCRFTKGRLLIN